MTKLWAFEDIHNWGRDLTLAAQARGIDARLFESPKQPHDGYVFMHMHHHPSVRMNHKRIMEIMAVNKDLTLIPEYRSSVLYDDKIKQACELNRWMPRTRVFYSPGAARAFLDLTTQYPFISKSSEGASSHNVRLISTADEGRLEVRQAFSDLGIKTRYNGAQRGYLLWQDFVPDNRGDVRIIAVGNLRLVLGRGNRPDRPFASGSGQLEHVVRLNDDYASALAFANTFFASENFKWCGIDLVKDANGKWYVLETTVGWTMTGYYPCAFFNADGSLEGRKGDQIWNVLLDEVEAGVFDIAAS